MAVQRTTRVAELDACPQVVSGIGDRFYHHSKCHDGLHCHYADGQEYLLAIESPIVMKCTLFISPSDGTGRAAFQSTRLPRCSSSQRQCQDVEEVKFENFRDLGDDEDGDKYYNQILWNKR